MNVQFFGFEPQTAYFLRQIAEEKGHHVVPEKMHKPVVVAFVATIQLAWSVLGRHPKVGFVSVIAENGVNIGPFDVPERTVPCTNLPEDAYVKRELYKVFAPLLVRISRRLGLD